DEIVTGGLAREVTVGDARREQTLARTTRFQFFVNGPHFLCNERPVFVRRLASLLELPLPFEERRLVDVGEDIRERYVFDHTRTVERRTRDGRAGAHFGAARVRGVGIGSQYAARARGTTADAGVRLLADQV